MNAKTAVDVGSVISGRYEILACLGQGGTGTVYRAKTLPFGEVVALKLLFDALVPDEQSVARFYQEAQAASLLNHPCLTTVYDSGMAESGQPYLAMELIEGTTLADKIAQEGQLPIEETLKIFVQVCEGLEYAHEHHVVHRDLKPSNIMLTTDGDSEMRVKILDFGLAKIQALPGEESLHITRSGQLVGSPFYMSPEQARGGDVDHRTDLYSLGCSIYEALTGGPPHVGQSAMSTLMKRETDLPLSLAQGSLGKSFPEQIEKVVGRLLNRLPEGRFQSAREVREDLERLLKDEPIKTWPTPGMSSSCKEALPSRAIPWKSHILLIGAFAVATACGFSIFLNFRPIAERKRGNQEASNIEKDKTFMIPEQLPNALPSLKSDIFLNKIEEGKALRRSGDFEGSVKVLQSAVEIFKKKFGPKSAAEGAACRELGETFINMGDKEHAYLALTQAFQLAQNPHVDGNESLAILLSRLGELYKQDQKDGKVKSVDLATRSFARAADLFLSLPKPNPFMAGKCLSDEGRIFIGSGNYKSAEPKLKRAISLFESLPKLPVGVYFVTRKFLSDCYRVEKRFNDALRIDAESLAICEHNGQAKELQLVSLLNRVAFDRLTLAGFNQTTPDEINNSAVAERLYKKALQFSESEPEKFKGGRMEAIEGLGDVYTRRYSSDPLYFQKALPCYEKALKLNQLNSKHEHIHLLYEKLGWLWGLAGNKDKQMNYFSLALGGPKSLAKQTVKDQIAMSAFYRKAKNYTAASAVCKQLQKAVELNFGRESSQYSAVIAETEEIRLAQK